MAHGAGVVLVVLALLASACGGGGGSASERFTCPRASRVLGDAPPIPDREELDAIAERVRRTGWDGFEVRRVEATHLGVVALVAGDLQAARRVLAEVGAAQTHAWDDSLAPVGVDAAGQVREVLQGLLEPAVRDVRAAVRGIPGQESIALWPEAGAVLLQWKAPVPTEVRALAGRRPDGVRVIVEPTRYSRRDIRAASERVVAAIRAGRIEVDWSTASGCADGSGLVVGVQPHSLADRAAELEAQLAEVAGMPVRVVPEEPPVPLAASTSLQPPAG